MKSTFRKNVYKNENKQKVYIKNNDNNFQSSSLTLSTSHYHQLLNRNCPKNITNLCTYII